MTTVFWEENATYLTVFIEVPLYAKNMIWGSFVTAADSMNLIVIAVQLVLPGGSTGAVSPPSLPRITSPLPHQRVK